MERLFLAAMAVFMIVVLRMIFFADSLVGMVVTYVAIMTFLAGGTRYALCYKCVKE